MEVQQACVAAYRRHKNLKLAAGDVGIPWQTVYVHLRNAGEPVTGDKLKYGSETDKLAAKGEQLFAELVPSAHDSNASQYQSKFDFIVRGHLVDVKTSRLRQSNKASKLRRWAFCLKKQEENASFFVCFGLADDEDRPAKTLLIPGEIARRYQTISLNERGGKWADYEVDPLTLADFFESLPQAI